MNPADDTEKPRREPGCDLTQIALNRPRSRVAKVLYVLLITWGVVTISAIFVLSAR